MARRKDSGDRILTNVSFTIYYDQVSKLGEVAKVLFDGNVSRLIREIIDSKEFTEFVKRKAKETAERIKGIEV